MQIMELSVEEFEAKLKKQFQEFKADETASGERKIVHKVARELDLFSISKGSGTKRSISVYKTETPLNLNELGMHTKTTLLRDFNLPIPLEIYGEAPLWQHYLELYDPLFKTKEKLNLLNEALTELRGERAFFVHYESVKEKMIEAIGNTEAFKRFASQTDEEFAKEHPLPADIPFPPETKFYTPSNEGILFISLDLKAANFNSLHYVDPSIVLNFNSWEELAGSFTKFKYFQQAKTFRQRVFGSLPSEPQVRMWVYLIRKVYVSLVQKGICKVEEFCTSSSDEMILTVNEDTLVEKFKQIKEFINNELVDMRTFVKVECFRLYKFPIKPYYVKEIFVAPEHDLTQTQPSFKCIPQNSFAQCYKYYFKLPLNDSDLMISTKKKLNFFQPNTNKKK